MRTLISGGTVVSMDPALGDLDRGDVLVPDGVIVDVAERIDAPDGEVIDATDRIVLPGFVDTHRHTWQTAFRGVGADWTFAEYLAAIHGKLRPRYRPEDVYLGNLLGRLEALNSGVTTMLDWFHCAQSPEHADAGCSVSISPDVELKMGMGWPMTGRMLAAGLRPTLSIDDTPSAGGDMFATMRTAYVMQRGLDGGLRSRDVLEFATVDGARACGLAARTGSITPGKDADVILLRADDLTVFPASNPAGTIVTAGHPGLVDTVLVAGRVVKRDGMLVDVDLPALRTRLFESRNRIAAAAGIPLDGTWRPWPQS